jgi:acyl carrier protein/NRPS condensation-like uncharacterized protein
VEGVRECVVVVKENDRGEKNLVAYVSVDNISEGEIKRRVSNDLPQYMIPRIIILDSLPLMPNGKVDRDRLPEPALKVEEEYEAPRDKLEATLVEIWAEVLGMEKGTIGINANFFELGGHSLKATLVASKIHKKLNKKVPLAEIFKTPTIRELAGYINGVKTYDSASPIEPVENKDYYLVSSAQKRLYIMQQMEVEGTSYNMPAVVILEGGLERAKLEAAFLQLIKRHESFRTSFQMIGNEPGQRIQKEVPFELQYHEEEASLEIERIVKNFVRPFDLSQPPLLRVGLIKIEAREHILMVDMHHIISDGTSMGVFVKEFMTFYSREELPALRLQYKDFSEWQNNIIALGKLKQQEEYWLNKFKGDIPVLNMNMLTDYPNPPGNDKSLEGTMISFEIDNDLTAQVKQLVLETETTLHIVLLAVYNILLSKYTGQQDIIVGSGIAGRRHVDLENIIGMFVNMLPMRNRPKESKTFREFLEEVKKNALEAYENQDFQFNELVMKLDIERNYRRNPLFDTQFTLQNVEIEPVEIPGLKLKSYPYGIRMIQFDLSLNGMETGETVLMTFEYPISLFKPTTIEKMAKHYIEILKQVIENKHITLKDMTISHALVAGKSGLSKEDSMAFGF